MSLEIKEKKENPLLSRTEITAELTFDKQTPSNADVAGQIAAIEKTDQALVKVNRIATEFGNTKADVEAVIYASKEAMENIERKSRKQRRQEKEDAAKAKEEAAQKAKEEAEAAKAAAEAPAEEAKEAPAEEAKEAPAEEKKEEKSE